MPARILVIEDNPTNLELMAYLLGAFGHVVTRAVDGEDGLKSAKNGEFDLILADVLMPKLDGYEFARRMKADPARRSIPIVAVTALAMVGDRDRMLSAGFDGYLAKPINPESFLHDVDGYLKPEKRAGPRAIASEPAGEVERVASSGKVVLVVDDVPANVEVIRATVESAGHRVMSARSVRDAMRSASDNPPNLVLADIDMPGGDGFELLRSFKADARLQRIPVIFISSTYWHEADKKRGLELGAVKYIVRPIDPQTLLAEVNDTLANPADG